MKWAKFGRNREREIRREIRPANWQRMKEKHGGLGGEFARRLARSLSLKCASRRVWKFLIAFPLDCNLSFGLPVKLWLDQSLPATSSSFTAARKAKAKEQSAPNFQRAIGHTRAAPKPNTHMSHTHEQHTQPARGSSLAAANGGRLLDSSSRSTAQPDLSSSLGGELGRLPAGLFSFRSARSHSFELVGSSWPLFCSAEAASWRRSIGPNGVSLGGLCAAGDCLGETVCGRLAAAD